MVRVSLKVEKSTRDMVMSLKKKWKKKHKTTSVDDVILKLYRDRKAYKDQIAQLKDEVTRLQSLESPAPPETTPSPTVAPQPKENVEVSKEAIVAQSHPCEFYKFDPESVMVHCSRDFTTKGVIHKVPKELCDRCWSELQPEREALEKAHELFRQAMVGQDPFKDYPCPYNARQTDPNLQLVYCAQRISKGKITERQVNYFRINTVDQCKDCIELFNFAQRMKDEKKQAQAKNRELNQMPRVNWQHADGYSELGRR